MLGMQAESLGVCVLQESGINIIVSAAGCRAALAKDDEFFRLAKEGVAKWTADADGKDAFDNLYETAMRQLYHHESDRSKYAGEICLQMFSGVAIPAHSDPRAPSKTIVARASHSFHHLGPFYSDVAIQGEGASGEECEWYSRIVALFRAKAPYGDSGEYVDLVFMRYYWQETTDGRVDVHGNTQFPLLRWSEAGEDEGAWGLSDIACILRVVHVIRTWSDKLDFQINFDAPV